MNSTTLEVDGRGGPHTGIVGYVHGYGIDEPVALDKDRYKVLPFADWGGHFDLGVCDTVRCSSTIKFPQRNVFGAANWAGNLPGPFLVRKPDRGAGGRVGLPLSAESVH